MTPAENRFVAGYADGREDRLAQTGRAISQDPTDYQAGYVAGKYQKLLGRKVRTLDEALEVQISEIWHGQEVKP